MAIMTYIDGFRKISSNLFEYSRLFGASDISFLEPHLLILNLYRFHRFDGRIHQFQNNADVIHALNEICLDPSVEDTYYYSQVYDKIRPIIISSEGQHLVDFLNVLSEVPDEWYEQYFPQLFDDILFALSEQTRPSGFLLQPKELTELLYSIVDIPQNATVYDPFAGVASFAIDLPQGTRFTGQEINREIYALAILRMMAHGKKGFDIHNEDSFTHWRSRTYSGDENITKYDYIISFPPIGARRNVSEADLEEELFEWDGKQISLEEYFISNGECGLYLGGQMAGIFSLGILFQGGNTGLFREELVSKGLINTVIELPAGLLTTTSIGLCAIVFNNFENQGDSIRFVDAKSFTERQGRRNVLKVKELLDAIHLCNPEFVKDVPVTDVIQQNYILTPSRYIGQLEDILEIPEGFELIPLGDIFCTVQGQTSQLSQCRVIKGRDLVSDDSFTPLNISALDIESVRNGHCRILDKECLLVLRVGQLKPTMFKPDFSTPVTCNSNVTALVPLEDMFFPYVISELRKDYVRKQVDAFSVGVAMRSMTLKDLLNIRILMPCDRSFQQISFENEQRIIREQKLKSLEVDDYLKTAREQVLEMIRIRKHRIKPYLSGINSNIDNILEEVEEKGNLSLEYELDTDYTILDAIRNMKNNLDEANRLFSALTMETNIGEVESVDLCDFLDSYSFNPTIPSAKFGLRKLYHRSEDDPLVRFNRDNLKEVLDELVHNAEKHFVPGQNNAAVTLDSYKDDKGRSVLQVCNNGQPLPDDFDMEKAFTAGYHKDKDGTGQGLFRLKQICDAFGAKITLARDDKSEWSVCFNILFKNA